MRSAPPNTHGERESDGSSIGAILTKTASDAFGSARTDEALASLETMTSEVGREGVFGHVALVHESIFAAYDGDIERARRLSDDAIAMGERLGVEFYVAASSGFRGRIEALAGDWRAAERFTRREHDILERLGDEGHRSTTSANLAVVLCELGDMEEAESLAEAGDPPAADDDLASQVTGRVALARVRSARGRHEDAIRLARGRGRTVRGCRVAGPERRHMDGARDGAPRSRSDRRSIGRREDGARPSSNARATSSAIASTQAFLKQRSTA